MYYRTGKRDSENTDLFIRDLRERILGTPEISTDGFHPYRNAIRDAFGARVAHGFINKTYSVTDLRKNAAHRYSPAAVVAVSREAVIGAPTEISTSYAERSNLSLPHGVTSVHAPNQRFQQKLENHAAAVSLYGSKSCSRGYHDKAYPLSRTDFCDQSAIVRPRKDAR